MRGSSCIGPNRGEAQRQGPKDLVQGRRSEGKNKDWVLLIVRAEGRCQRAGPVVNETNGRLCQRPLALLWYPGRDQTNPCLKAWQVKLQKPGGSKSEE